MQLTINIDTENFEEASEQIEQLNRVSGSTASKTLQELLIKEGSTAIESKLDQLLEVLTKELEQRTNYENEQRQRLSVFFGEENE